MPELKRTFASGRMNKDLDERLVPAGEYRDAMNIQVATSDGASVGVVSNLLGNTNLTESTVAPGSTCVGSIAHGKEDKIYYLVCGGDAVTTDPVTTKDHTILKDYVIEYDFVTKSYRYVVVDIHKIVTHLNIAGTTSSSYPHIHIPNLGDAAKNITGIRIGMVIEGYIGGVHYTQSDNVTVISIKADVGNNGWNIELSESFVSDQYDLVTFHAPRVLSFHHNNYIDAINIVDGMMFWVDGVDPVFSSEPKKINIARCIRGTGGLEYMVGGGIDGHPAALAAGTLNKFVLFNGENDYFHTRLTADFRGDRLEIVTDGDGGEKTHWLTESNITVIRPRPLTPLILEMSSTEKVRENSSGVSNAVFSTILKGNTGSNWADVLTGDPLPIGTTLANVTFTNAVDFREGDILILTSDEDDGADGIFTDHEVRVKVIVGCPVGLGGAPDVIQTSGYTLEVMAIDSGIAGTDQLWYVKLEQTAPLFETKFPRFSYRYKYEDGEYSTFAPWSEIAFMPGEYDYYPKKGHNLGMINNLRNLKLKQYFVEDSLRPRDVIEVDILYKESGKPNVYSVKTIKHGDGSPNWPEQTHERGEYELETEIIHAVLPSNQLIRPWDNVPRFARAQEITGNRLVFGNYIQNYNVASYVGMKLKDPEIEISLWSDEADFDDLDSTKKSIKTMRTYQVGVVFSDKYGRETPVLGSQKKGGIKIEKLYSAKWNKLEVKLKTPPPPWAETYKFFIKETSNEYYNLAMDRWYNAEDGNIWLSFPSSERNKVTDETFLILKKAHGTDVPVTDLAKYKVLAIKAEAPDFIKIDKKSLGVMYNGGPGFGDQIGNSGGGFPVPDSRTIEINRGSFTVAFGSVAGSGPNGTETIGKLLSGGTVVKIKMFGPSDTSKAYEIVKIQANANDTVITIDGKFGDDMAFTSTNETYATRIDGLGIEVITEIPENKPEFDGRFFVKIYKDLVLQSHVMSRIKETDFVITSSYGCSFIRPLVTHPASGSSYTWGDSINPGITSNQMAQFSNAYVGVGSPANENWAAMSNGRVGNYGPGLGYWFSQFSMPAYLFWNQQDRLDNFFIDQASQYSHDGTGVDGAGTFGKLPNPKATSANNIPGVHSSGTSTDGTWVGVPLEERGQGVYNNNRTIDISWAGIGPGYEDNWKRSWKGSSGANKDGPNWNGRLSSGASDGWVSGPSGDARKFIDKLAHVGTRFKWAEDPDDIIYTVKGVRSRWGIKNYKNDAWSALELVNQGLFPYIPNDTWDYNKEQLRANCQRQRWSLNLDKELGQGPAGYHPLNSPDASVPGLRHDGTNTHQIQLLDPFTDEDDNYFIDNPAIFETEPTEDVGLDIYYEAGRDNPIDINEKTNEQFAPINSTFWNSNTLTSHTVTSWSDRTVTFTPAFGAAAGLSQYDAIRFTRPDRSVIQAFVDSGGGNSATTLTIFGDSKDFGFVGGESLRPCFRPIQLSWHNCYSFGNGVESDRIRDDYNAVTVDNGVKASSTLNEPYKEEHRKSGLIYSGIYNSTSGVNSLNQFIQGEKITKDLNPSYGSIQKLFTRNTDLVTLCEDKILKVSANKDALFNADGKPQLIATDKVLGQTIPFTGDWGISTNPESFVSESYRAYFTDRTRGVVLRLSQDGLTPISDLGMKDWFADNLRIQNYVSSSHPIKTFGSWDDKKEEYNLTVVNYWDAGRQKKFTTLSFSEKTKGWISFKSFHPESGVSLNNEYYTFKDGNLHQHHDSDSASASTSYNTFYGDKTNSSITFLMNDDPGSIKSFNTMNYEGSQAKITAMITASPTDAAGNTLTNLSDGEYYNLNAKDGWYTTLIRTDKQTGDNIEFKEKEGKWFGVMKGEETTLNNLDTEEFSVQGIGMAVLDHSDPDAEGEGKTTIREWHESSTGTNWD